MATSTQPKTSRPAVHAFLSDLGEAAEQQRVFRDVYTPGTPSHHTAFVRVGALGAVFRRHPRLPPGTAIAVELPQYKAFPAPAPVAAERVRALLDAFKLTDWPTRGYDRGKGAVLKNADFALRYAVPASPGSSSAASYSTPGMPRSVSDAAASAALLHAGRSSLRFVE